MKSPTKSPPPPSMQVAPDPQVLHLLAERDRRKPAARQLLGAAETARSAGRDR